MSDEMISIPHESNELIPLVTKVDGVLTITGIQYSITAETAGPGSWTPAEISGGKAYARVNGLTAGRYAVWIQVTAATEVAVIRSERGLLLT